MTDSVDELLGIIEPDSTSEVDLVEEPTEAMIDEAIQSTDAINDNPTPGAELGEINSIAAATAVPEPQPNLPDILDGIMARINPPNITSKYLRVLIYGDPGVRKTTFCASAPGVLVYETDTGGSESLLNFPETARTPVLPFKSTYQLNQLVDAMLNDDPRLSHIETFVIDTYTMYQAKDLAELPRKGDGGPDYLKNTENLKILTDKLRNIPKHLILTTHVKEEKDQTTGIILRRPELTPKVSQAVIAMMGIIGYMTLDGDSWQLQLQPTPGVAAKCRVGGLPATLTNPDFNTILEARNKTIATNSNPTN